MDLKQCNKCKQFLALNCFTNDRSKKDGLRTICRTCHADWRQSNPDKVKAQKKRNYLRHREEKLEKSIHYYRENCEARLQYEKMRYQRDREKRLAAVRDYNQRNREKRKTQARNYYQRNRATFLFKRSLYRVENAEAVRASNRKYRLKNRDRIAAWMKQYVQDSRSRIHRLSKTRYNTFRQSIPGWADFEAIQAVYIAAAQQRSMGFEVHVDHIDPLVSPLICGMHVHSNLQIIEAQQNQQKSNYFVPYGIDANGDRYDLSFNKVELRNLVKAFKSQQLQ
ncbi:hypothetical protein IQ268_08960 [Oculatella sp. LEGE 06141]|uniref:hypothetical protein n=1 Tax=Oculatella sp. LEGE 06141 TaxID=1828648 RepID=UPI00188285D9|nr:hypothetical protein [Oculatella sp. LEGE 06141]MBE9178688.1 hypothetical protein [Oculatella sp. LEGE 06141]